MIFTIAIYGSPYTYQASDSAYQFVSAALELGHQVYRIFFYHDGVYNGSGLVVPPQGQVNIPERWSQLAEHLIVLRVT